MRSKKNSLFKMIAVDNFRGLSIKQLFFLIVNDMFFAFIAFYIIIFYSIQNFPIYKYGSCCCQYLSWLRVLLLEDPFIHDYILQYRDVPVVIGEVCPKNAWWCHGILFSVFVNFKLKFTIHTFVSAFNRLRIQSTDRLSNIAKIKSRAQ